MAGCVALLLNHVPDKDCQKLTGGITGGGNDLLELLDAGDHRVILVEENLVVKTFNDVFYDIVINQYTGIVVNGTVDPYLDFPPVPVKIGAFSLVMEQSVTCIKVHLFVYPGIHY